MASYNIKPLYNRWDYARWDIFHVIYYCLHTILNFTIGTLFNILKCLHSNRVQSNCGEYTQFSKDRPHQRHYGEYISKLCTAPICPNIFKAAGFHCFWHPDLLKFQYFQLNLINHSRVSRGRNRLDAA